MYLTIADIFLIIGFIIAIPALCLVIGSAIWRWIDDKEFESMLAK